MSLQLIFDKMGLELGGQIFKPVEPVRPDIVRNPYVVSQRVVLCGSYIEHYQYESPYVKGMPREWRPVSKFRRLKVQELITEANVKRARAKIRRLVNCNSDLDQFLTLTFDGDYTSFDDANPYFENFVKRCKRLDPNFKYLCVPEFQGDYYYGTKIKKEKGGNIHYHLLCNWSVPMFTSDYQKKLWEVKFQKEVWQNGFVKIKKINDVDNVGAYICKYLGKANFDKRLFGKKKFFYSINLKRPLIVDKLEQVLELLAYFSLENLVEKFKCTFDSDYFGRVQYKQYKINILNNIFDLQKVACT